MEHKSQITVITPSFNQKNFIERTIHSVLDQEVDFPVEYLVMDGGSTDGTVDVLKKYEGKLKWISQKDCGQSDAINKGMDLAQGEIVAWLNSDDTYLPGTLQKVKNYFDTYPENQWLYGNCKIIDENDREIRKSITFYKNILSRHFNYNTLLIENFISQPSVFFKTELFNRAGKLTHNLHYAMDFDLWIRFAKSGKPIVIRDNLACFRIHENSKSTQNFKNLFTEQYQVHQKHDNRKVLLWIHRLSIIKTLVIYNLISKLNAVRSVARVN